VTLPSPKRLPAGRQGERDRVRGDMGCPAIGDMLKLLIENAMKN